jgi:DNA uptake protein ComE-like DNA-binding protein
MIRNDRKIAIALLLLAVAFAAFFWKFGDYKAEPQQMASDSIFSHQKSARNKRPTQYYATESQKVERFPFDPNTADSTQLLRLGLQPWQVRNIYKYRAHGGIYRQKEDFARLYGLTVKQYRELEPYIRISSDYLPASTLVGRKRETVERDTLRYPIKIQENEHVVLNTADTTQLKKVPGIGSYYASEIIRHGQRLGGFVNVDQLDEIENFPKDAKQYFVIANAHPKRMNINRLTLQQLRRHPYINFYQAKAITDYRRLHGDIKSIDELRLSKDFTDEAIHRLEPYIEY